MAKLISMKEFCERRTETEHATAQTDKAIQDALKMGMCERCGSVTDGLILLHGQWLCRACLGV